MPSDYDDLVPDDFHETDAGLPFMAVLGALILDWNLVEHQMSGLIWHYLGNIEKGAAVTASLGNVSRGTLLIQLADTTENDDAAKDRVKFAAKCFDRLRESRNILAHSMRIDPQPEGLVWTRVSRESSIKFLRAVISFDDLAKVRADIARLSHLLLHLYLYLSGTHVPLPEKFPLPGKLRTLPPVTPKHEQPPPQSSEG